MNHHHQPSAVKWFQQPDMAAPHRSIGRLRLALMVALMVGGLSAGLALSTWTFNQTNHYLMTMLDEPASSLSGSAISQ